MEKHITRTKFFLFHRPQLIILRISSLSSSSYAETRITYLSTVQQNGTSAPTSHSQRSWLPQVSIPPSSRPTSYARVGNVLILTEVLRYAEPLTNLFAINLYLRCFEIFYDFVWANLLIFQLTKNGQHVFPISKYKIKDFIHLKRLQSSVFTIF